MKQLNHFQSFNPSTLSIPEAVYKHDYHGLHTIPDYKIRCWRFIPHSSDLFTTSINSLPERSGRTGIVQGWVVKRKRIAPLGSETQISGFRTKTRVVILKGTFKTIHTFHLKRLLKSMHPWKAFNNTSNLHPRHIFGYCDIAIEDKPIYQMGCIGKTRFYFLKRNVVQSYFSDGNKDIIFPGRSLRQTTLLPRYLSGTARSFWASAAELKAATSNSDHKGNLTYYPWYRCIGYAQSSNLDKNRTFSEALLEI